MSIVLNRKLMRLAGLLLVAGAALSLSRAAVAQYVWAPTAASSGTWSTAANWTTGAPVSGIDTTLSFSNIYYGAGFSSTNDIAGNFDLNMVRLRSESVNSTVANNHLTIGGSVGSTLTFNTSSAGTGPSVWIDGAGNSTLGTSLNVALAANLALNATSTGQLYFLAALTNAGVGNRDVTINTGNGLVNFNPTSTAGWTGNLNLNSGYLTLGGAGAIGSSATNSLVVNGGTLGVTVATAIANNVTLNSDMRINVFTASNALFTGTLSGVGGINVAPAGGATNALQLEGTSSFTGAVTANGGNVSPGTVTLRNTGGSLTGATSYNLFSGSTLNLDNSTSGSNADRVRNDATINLHRGNLTLTAHGTNAVNESVGTIAFDGLGVVTVNSNTTATGAATTLTAGSLSRQDRGTLSITGTGLGTAAAATGVGNLIVSSSLAGDLVGGGGAAGSTNQSILPYAFGRDRIVAAGLDAHVVSGPNGLRPLAMSEYNQSLYLLHGTTSQQNVAVRNDLLSATAGLGGALVDRDTTVNALIVNGATGTGNNGTSLYGPGTLTVTSGSIITGTSGGAATNRGPLAISNATLDFGAAEGIVHAAAAGTLSGGTSINSVITGTGGLTKSGLGNLSLNGANTFSGPVTLNGGTLNISSDANLGNAGNSVRLNGGLNGTTPSLLVFQPSIMFTDATAQAMTTARSVTLGAAGGGVGVASPNAELTLSSPISGSGALVIGSTAATGLVNLTGINTHTGGTVVNGQLAINSSAALGSGLVALESGAVLRPTAGTTNLTISNNLRVDGPSTMYVPTGSVMTLAGAIQYSPTLPASTNFTKLGGGTLEVTAPSQYYGNFALGASTPTVVNSQTQYEQVGAVVLRDNGSFGAASVVNLNGASELVLDNTAANVNNRLALNGNLQFNGGALTLKGNSAAPTAETVGAAIFVGANGMHTMTVRPDAAQNASLTLSSHSINTSSGGSWILVRGDSLGSVPGAGVANVFIGTTPTGAMGSGTAPILTNNLIPGMVASASSSTDATSFATYSTTQGVQPLAAYASGATLANFAAINNVDLATPQTLTVATPFSANALRLRGSASLDLNGDTLTVGTGMVLSTRTGGTTLAGGGTLSLTGQGLIYNTTDLNMGSTVLGGSANLSKSGQGTLTLASANPGLTGFVNVGGGSLKFSSATSLPSGALVFLMPSVMGAAKLDLNGFNVSLTRVSGMGTVDLGNGGSLSLSGNNFSSAVNIIGTGRTVGGPALRFNNGMTLGGLSSFTGQTVLSGGTLSIIQNTPAGGTGNGPLGSSAEPLQLGDAGTTAAATLSLGTAVDTFNRDLVVPSPAAGGAPLAQIMGIQSAGSTGTVNIGSNISLGRSFRLAGTAGSYTSGQATISGVISNNGSDAGSIDFNTGNWNLTGNNTYSGGTTLANATGAMLGLGHDNALGTGPVSVSATAATLRATGGARTISNNIVFTAATTNGLGITGVNDITFAGTVALGSTGQMLNITNAANTTFSNTISGGPATGDGLIKAGGGTLRLTAANAYSGATRIADGALLANNTTGSAFGAGNATVEPGAMLGGIGFVSGTVSVLSGGIIAPGQDVGASVGTLTLGGLSTVSGSIFTFDLQDQNTPATNDMIALSGSLGSVSGIVDVCPKPGFVAGIFPLFTYSGSQLTSGGLTLTPGFLAAYPSAFIDYTTQANTVLLNVPSPGAAGLLSLGGLLAARRRRQR